MVFASQDARPGRTIGQAFECYGATSAGGTLSTYSSANTFSNQGSNQPCSTYGNIGLINGHTLAQTLAGISYLSVVLSTNDVGFPVGSPGDAPTSGTIWGEMAWVETTLHTAAPQIRVVWVHAASPEWWGTPGLFSWRTRNYPRQT